MPIKIIRTNPSYYELIDGTILELIIRLDSVIQDKTEPYGYALRTTNIAKTYVSKENRKPELASPFTPSELRAGIIEEDVDSQELSTNPSEYEIDNQIIEIRTIASQIKKTRFYSQDGEPVYSVDMVPLMKVKKKPL